MHSHFHLHFYLFVQLVFSHKLTKGLWSADVCCLKSVTCTPAVTTFLSDIFSYVYLISVKHVLQSLLFCFILKARNMSKAIPEPESKNWWRDNPLTVVKTGEKYHLKETRDCVRPHQKTEIPRVICKRLMTQNCRPKGLKLFKQGSNKHPDLLMIIQTSLRIHKCWGSLSSTPLSTSWKQLEESSDKA